MLAAFFVFSTALLLLRASYRAVVDFVLESRIANLFQRLGNFGLLPCHGGWSSFVTRIWCFTQAALSHLSSQILYGGWRWLRRLLDACIVRGCIPEVVTQECGCVIPPAAPFVPAALAAGRGVDAGAGDLSGGFGGRSGALRELAADQRAALGVAASADHWRRDMTAKAVKLLRILRAADWRAALRRHRAAAGAGLVTRCDAGEVAEALCTLLADPARRVAMGAAGRALVRRQWTWDVVASQLTAEYEKIIARHREQRTAGSAAR